MPEHPERRFLFVCVGNICRSPLAAALLAQRLGDEVVVESAGIFGLVGEPAPPEAIAAARQAGLQIETHRARHVRDLDLGDYDAIIGLTPHIASVLIQQYGAAPERVVTLDVDDPYGADVETFRQCLTEIERQLEKEILRS